MESLPFDSPSTGGLGLGLARDSKRHPEEPARQRIAPPDRARLLGQDQKRRLRRVLSVVKVAQHLAADTQNHRPVAVDQRGEGIGRVGVASPGLKSFQERLVR